MGSGGRPRLLDDPEKRRTLFAMISVGAGVEAAARFIGCTLSTVYRETRRNEEFAQQLREAEARSQLLPLRLLRDAAGSHWRAAAWLLERTCPEQFARRSPQSISPARVSRLLDDVAAIVDQICTDDEQCTAICDHIAELQADVLIKTHAQSQDSHQPPSDLDRFVAKMERQQNANVTALKLRNCENH